MITIDDKLDMFKKVIFDDIEKKNSVKKEELIKKYDVERDKLESDLKLRKEQIIHEARKKAEDKKKSIIAEAENEAYFEMLRQKEQFIETLSDTIVQSFKALDSELEVHYKIFLQDCINKAAKQFAVWDAIFIEMLEVDMKKYKAMLNEGIKASGFSGAVSFEKASEDIVGGFTIEDGNRRIRIDNSIKTLISENRGRIGSIISQRLDDTDGVTE